MMDQTPNQALDGLRGTRGFPLVGDVLKMLPDPLPYIQQLHSEFGNVFFAHFARNRKNVLLLGPNATELALVSQADKFSNELGYSELSGFLGKRTILFQDGADHKFLRKAFNPAFKPDNLRQYLSNVALKIDDQLTNWSTDSSQLVADINLLTLRIASQSIVGVSVEEDAESINTNFLKVLGGMVSMVPDFPGSPKWQGKKGRLYVDGFVRSRISERRANPSHDVFSQLCAAELGLTDDDIVDNMVGVLFASYETTASTIAMMLHTLAFNPEWQEPLRHELASLMDSDEVKLQSVQQCIKTELVFKETLRLYSPLSFLPRRTVESVEVEGFTIPANTPITLAPRFVHHMPSIYSNPEIFDPERFSANRAEDQAHRCAWIPFGKGAHACIGMHFARMEVFTFFSRLLNRFRVESIDSKLSLSHVPVLKPAQELPVRLVQI